MVALKLWWMLKLPKSRISFACLVSIKLIPLGKFKTVSIRTFLYWQQRRCISTTYSKINHKIKDLVPTNIVEYYYTSKLIFTWLMIHTHNTCLKYNNVNFKISKSFPYRCEISKLIRLNIKQVGDPFSSVIINGKIVKLPMPTSECLVLLL